MSKVSQTLVALLLCSLLVPLVISLSLQPSSASSSLFESDWDDSGHHDQNSAHPPNFSLALTHLNISLLQGASTVIGVTITSSSVSVGKVTLASRNLPEGVSVLYEPASGLPNPSFSSLMLINANSSSPGGTFTINVTGTSSTRILRTVTLALTIVSASSLITLVSASAPTVARLGDTIRVNATVANYGPGTVKVVLNLLANDTRVDTVATGIRAVSLFKTVFTWNTSKNGVSGGSYLLAVQVLFPSVRGTDGSIFQVGTLLLEVQRQASVLTSGVNRMVVVAVAIAEAGAVLAGLFLIRRSRIMAFRRGVQTRLR